MLCDVHSHIVYGVDDGAKNKKMSYKMLKAAKAQGITRIICTSHITPGYKKFDLKKYQRHLSEIQKISDEKKYGIKLYTGCEILYTEHTLKYLRRGKALTLANSDYVLVEFMPNVTFDVMRRAALDLSNAGYRPIFAHVERYSCLRSMKKLSLLREECGVLAQMNAVTVLEAKKIFGNHWAKKALKKGLIDIVASDTHNIGKRPNKLKKAMDFIEGKYGYSYAKHLRKCSKFI